MPPVLIAGVIAGAACAVVGLILIPRRRALMLALGLVMVLIPALIVLVVAPHLDRHREVATTAPIISLDQTSIDGAGYLAPTQQGHLRYAVQVDQDAYLMGKIDPEKDLVLDDADIEASAGKIFATAFINNGQTCAALKRLYVQDGIYDQLCEALTNIANSVTTGNGMNEGSDFGPLQNENQLNIVKEMAEDAKARGGRFLTGGEQTDTSGYYFPITLVADIEDGAKLVDEEQFGPILPIIRFGDVEDAIKRANSNPNGLGGSVWSQNLERARDIAARLECGTAWINHHAVVQPNAPFGGVKQSGFGVEFGEAGLKEFTSIQTLFVYK